MFTEMKRLRMDVKREIRALRTEIKETGPRLMRGMEPTILAAKRELDKEAGLNGGDSWARTAKKNYLQNQGIFENEISGISLAETEGMEKELSARMDGLKSNLFWAKLGRTAFFSVFAFASAVSSASYFHAATVEKMLPFQQKATFAIAALAAVCTAAFLWLGKKSIERAYESALEDIGAAREWMEKKASEVSGALAEKIDSHKDWWLGLFRGNHNRLLH